MPRSSPASWSSPDVLVDELASGSINLKVRFHTESLRGNGLKAGTEVRRRMRAAFDAAGLDIYPSGVQVVQLRSPEPAGPGQGPPSPPAPTGNDGGG